MNEQTQYYKFIAGSVIVRRTGDMIEKYGKNGEWETLKIWPGAFQGMMMR